MEYRGNKENDCTLRITDLKWKLQVENGQHLDESTSPQYKDPVSSNYEDSYSCAVKGHEDLHSPAVCVPGQRCNRVTYTKRTICALKGSTVNISCTYVSYYYTKSSFWFRSDKSTPEDLTTDPGYAGRVEYAGTYKDPFTLRITDLREEDSAEYRFTFKMYYFEWGPSFPGTTLSVTGLQVKVTPAAEGQKTLTCSTTCTLTDNPTYIWYKNGQRLHGERSLHPENHKSERKDSAEYKFIFNTQTSRWGYSFPGTTLTVTDLQVKVTPATEAGKRTLTCSTTCTLTDNPTYIWYKNGHKVKEDTSSLYSDYFSDADSYSCAVKGHEDLHSPAVCQKCWSVTYTHQKICALKGSTVNISCSYTYPSYHEIITAFWFTKWSGKDPEDLSSAPGYEGHIEYLGDKESDCTLRITDLRLSDSAGYRFRFITSGEKFHGSPVSLTVTDVVLEMDPTSVSERENVTLTCRTKCTLDPITAYSWYKNGQPLPNSNTSSPVYILFSVSSEDTGRYSCAVEGHEDLPSAEETLTVRYGPRNTSVSVSPSGEIVGGSSVTLTCSSDANPPVYKYTWYKKNITSPKASGQSYSITNISSEDRGEYYCEAENTIASMNSTALMIIVAGKQTSVVTAAVGIIVVVLVLILCLSGLMWSRKVSKSTSNTRDTADDGQGDSSPVYDNISGMTMTSTAAQTAASDDQDDVHYASVHFSRSKNQEVPLYSTVQLHQPQKQDQDVQYAAVKFNLPSSVTQPTVEQAAEEASSVLYSTVNKPRTKKT
ncbi:B-cell receptor CD22-like [Salvelinus fontinalis]|uniref:B-cell receptor CD22-like n=1 Tax=Salvelinus fontinalis TaxID=8038 RepID=UPI002486834D|nr:B-cell receptor CD22-like [Salvelinus fontinalis]